MSETSLRIGFDASCLIPQPLTGVGYYTLHLLDALLGQPDGCRMSLFASSAQAAPPLLTALGQRAHALKTVRWSTRLKTWMWTTLQAPGLERFTGPIDIAHGGFHLLPPARNAKRLVTVFDLSHLRHPETHTLENVRLHTRILAQTVARADGIIAISESCKQEVVELLGAAPEKVHVVPGGVVTGEFDTPLNTAILKSAQNRLRIDRRYFIHLGTLEPRKNLPRLLEAYARILDRHSDCPLLVLAGHPGWGYEAVGGTIARFGLERAVIRTGYLAREEAVTLLRGAYACLYPSLYEGFGLPVLEAMAARVPVLTSNVSSLPEVVGDTGILVDPESVEAIAAGITQLLEDAEAARVRAEAGCIRAGQFSWQHSARQLAQAYRCIAEGADGGA